MALTYRGITYQPSAKPTAPSEQLGVYRGIPFRAVSGTSHARSQNIKLTYRGVRYTR